MILQCHLYCGISPFNISGCIPPLWVMWALWLLHFYLRARSSTLQIKGSIIINTNSLPHQILLPLKYSLFICICIVVYRICLYVHCLLVFYYCCFIVQCEETLVIIMHLKYTLPWLQEHHLDRVVSNYCWSNNISTDAKQPPLQQEDSPDTTLMKSLEHKSVRGLASWCFFSPPNVPDINRLCVLDCVSGGRKVQLQVPTSAL